MSRLRPSIEQLAVALGCGAWMAGFLMAAGLPVGSVCLLTLLGTLAVLLVEPMPVAAAAAVAGVQLLGSLIGVPDESAAGLASLVVAGYGLGRYAGRAAGLSTIALQAGALGLVREPWPANVAFAAFLLTGIWWFGRLVRTRTEAARRSGTEEARLRAEDLSAVTERVVAEERSRLAGNAVEVVRTAVRDMRREAVVAEQSLDGETIRRIQQRGTAAVGELRRLLGLLRQEPQEGRAAPSEPSRARRWPVDLGTALVLIGLVFVDGGMAGSGVPTLGIVLAALAVAPVSLRRIVPAVAAGSSAAVTVVSVGLPAPLAHGFGTTVGYALLVWSAVVAGERAARVGSLLLAASVLLEASRFDPANVPLVAAMVGLPAFAAHAWSERDREERAARSSAEALLAHRRSAIDAAVTTERLRIARELHDVASHAVGVMVLQAGAAAAQRARKPAEARAALRAVQDAGAEAAGELDVLLGVLDAGAVGPAGLARVGSEGLTASVAGLADRMRGAGLGVEVRVDGDPEDPEAAGVVYRVVQECLTNAARHARGAQVRVEIVGGAEEVTVTVTDDGPGTPGAGEGPGFGLVGVAERVRSSGGDVTAGPLPGRGFRVSARIPRGPARVAAADPVRRPMEQTSR